ncbi:MAG TPA: serine/threonine-protein kinase, partial [Planctomycetota bacterium]|nr:serine/threonine-protein kinase [Planctomycetota bacterium]
MENTLVGRCRLVRKIGQGGMGEVWLARHETLQKDVAVKILPADYARHPEAVERFLREARSAARLEHPNVVQVLDAGSQDGTHYIVMQYVDGTDLEKIYRKKGRLSTADALAVARRVALALGAAHKLGIVHRDIKPSNILIARKQGRVMVADFGLAREIGGDAGLTTEGSVMGTPHYLSPEQARGEAVDGRSDLYSLGGTLYTLLSGAMPYTGATPLSVAVKHASPIDRPKPLREIVPDLAPDVEALVDKLMAKNVSERFQSAEEVVAALDRLKSGKSDPSAPAIPAEPAQRRRQLLIAAGIAAGTLLLLLVLGAALSPGPAEKAFRGAVAARTEEERLARYREVARSFPGTSWAARAAEEMGRAFEREVKAARALPFGEAVGRLEGLRSRHPER